MARLEIGQGSVGAVMLLEAGVSSGFLAAGELTCRGSRKKLQESTAEWCLAVRTWTPPTFLVGGGEEMVEPAPSCLCKTEASSLSHSQTSFLEMSLRYLFVKPFLNDNPSR